MNKHSNPPRKVLDCVALLALYACASEAGHNNDELLSLQMQALFAEFPEAEQLDERSISWDDSRVVLSLVDETSAAQGECRRRRGRQARPGTAGNRPRLPMPLAVDYGLVGRIIERASEIAMK